MTILMTADAIGGVWTYAVDLSRGLAARGVQVVLAVMGAPLTDDQRAAAEQIAGLTVAERPFKLEWMDDPWPDVEASGEWLLDLARLHSVDVVHLNGYAHGALDFGVPVLIGAHSCVLSWYRAVKREAPSSQWQRYEAAVKRGLAGARLIVAPTRAMAMSLIWHYTPDPPVLAIHNGRDTSLYAPGKKEPFVLSAGRLWDEAKNVSALATVAPQLPWRTFVAGEGGTGDGRVTPLGRLSATALSQWYARASIYALPARYEPFGLSALEAALSGCALVLGDIPSLRELWDGAALFVDPADTPALGRQLQRLIADPRLLERLAGNARQRAGRYTIDAMADAYVRLYRQLAATPSVALPRRFACAS